MRRGTDKFEEGDFAKIFFENQKFSKYGIMNKGNFYEITPNNSRKICLYGEGSTSIKKKKISQTEFIADFKSKYKDLTFNTRNLNSLESLFLLKDFYKFEKKLGLLMQKDYKTNLNKVYGDIEVPSSIYFVAKNNFLDKKECFGVIVGESGYPESIIKNILVGKKLLDKEYGIVHGVPTVGRNLEIIETMEKKNHCFLSIDLELRPQRSRA